MDLINAQHALLPQCSCCTVRHCHRLSMLSWTSAPAPRCPSTKMDCPRHLGCHLQHQDVLAAALSGTAADRPCLTGFPGWQLQHSGVLAQLAVCGAAAMHRQRGPTLACAQQRHAVPDAPLRWAMLCSSATAVSESERQLALLSSALLCITAKERQQYPFELPSQCLRQSVAWRMLS